VSRMRPDSYGSTCQKICRPYCEVHGPGSFNEIINVPVSPKLNMKLLEYLTSPHHDVWVLRRESRDVSEQL